MARRLGIFRKVKPSRNERESAKRTYGLSHHSCAPRGGGGRHRNTSLPLFRPGDAVPESGIYEVLHDADHRQAHDAVMILGNQFPSCETCNERVRFRIVRTAPYIFQDEDFEDTK